SLVLAEHPRLGRYVLACAHGGPAPALLFTENDTNLLRLFGTPNSSPFVKDGINDCVASGKTEAVNPAGTGTKAAAHHRRTGPPAAAGGPPPGPQPRLDPPQRPRRHLHAGQVGVPVVRRLGPRLPLHPASAGGPGLRQAAAGDARAGVVPAPQRPGAGLRVEL